MGFAAGFGKAFADSFNQQTAIEADRDKTAMQYYYQNIIAERKERSEWERQSSQWAGMAQDLVQEYNLPPEAAPTLYSRLANGWSAEKVTELASKGQWDVPSKSAQPISSASSASGTGGGNLDQTQQSGLAPSAPKTQPVSSNSSASNTQDTSQNGGLLSRLFPGMRQPQKSSVQDRRQARIEERAERDLGISREEQKRILSGERKGPDFGSITPASVRLPIEEKNPQDLTDAGLAVSDAQAALEKNPNDPRLKARYETTLRQYDTVYNMKKNQAILEGKYNDESQIMLVKKDDGSTGLTRVNRADGRPGVWTDDKGQEVDGIIIPEEERKELMKMTEKFTPAYTKFVGKSAAFSGMTMAAQEMYDLASQDERILSPITANTVQFVANLAGEARSAASVLDEIMKDSDQGNTNKTLIAGDPSTLKRLEDAESALKSVDQSVIGEVGYKKALFDIQKSIFVYHLAASLGQEGRSLSEVERNNFEALVNNMRTLPKLADGLASVITNAKTNLNQEGQAITRNPTYRLWQESHNGMAPPGMTVDPVEKQITDPRTVQFLKDLDNYKNKMNSKADATKNQQESNVSVDNSENLIAPKKIPTIASSNKPVYKTSTGIAIYPTNLKDKNGDPIFIGDDNNRYPPPQ